MEVFHVSESSKRVMGRWRLFRGDPHFDSRRSGAGRPTNQTRTPVPGEPQCSGEGPSALIGTRERPFGERDHPSHKLREVYPGHSECASTVTCFFEAGS